jgi:hypothetical protein
MNSRQLKRFREKLLREWVGSWMLKPKTKGERIAAKLARSSIQFTKSNSFISSVAVASIDILGIKDLLSRKSLEEVAKEFAEPFYDLSGPAYTFGSNPLSAKQMETLGFRRMAGIHATSISDTLMLMRRPDWEIGNKDIAEAEAVIRLAEYVCKVIKINSIYGIRLRAAIAFGECIISVGRTRALLGLATGEASAWERQQEWIGGMLTPSATAALRRGAVAAIQINGRSFSPQYPNTLVTYAIPLKRNCPKPPEPQIALNWITGMTIGGINLVKAHIPQIQDADLPAGVKRKLRNTRRFAKHCETTPLHTSLKWD